ncbi:MAG: hypothetical protein AUG51_21560 [Acidobacteria bacterium 13_1_20CM_3_53_8]|nr:MAG: hypothetical protein AUG51_21560 [Acidobacteria bacterium 13_1_20CM_3_53_8]
MENEIQRAYETLAAWCRERDYAGHDPFDALNSRLFQSLPLKRSRTARLMWTQLFKRSPVNFRKLARVPFERNAKGTALFALAALSEFRRTRTKNAEEEARKLLEKLLRTRIEGFGGAAWGYNFDWQGRAFFAPKGAPTVVPTAFAARALVEATRTFGDEEYLKVARSACAFILNDLNRSEETNDEVCWSYSPLDSTCVFNASLLAAETLASVGRLTGERDLIDWSMRGARYVVRRQREDGSWGYGALRFQSWSDNFHTAFILTSLKRIIAACDNCPVEFNVALRKGYEFWRENFFLSSGWPKLYPEKLYPADAHSAGAAMSALMELKELDASAGHLAEKIAHWAIQHLRDPRGFFYYQRHRFYTLRTPYMRWSQAWMMYGLARLLEGKRQK